MMPLPRARHFAAATVLLFAGLAAVPAFAANKDMVQLQTQIQQLQDAVARLQQSNDERMGVLKDLVQQTADSVGKMSIAVNGMQLRMQNQQDAFGTKSDQLSGQIQSLNDSVDELKARLTRMEKALGDLQNGQQSTNAMLGNLPQGSAGGAAPPAAGAGSQPATGAGAGPDTAPPAGSPIPNTPPQSRNVPPPVAGPSSNQMYRTAYNDFMAGKNTLATPEFEDLIKNYPDDNLSGNAYFYLGEMAMRANKPSVAIKDYDHTIEHYPDNAKIPAAHLHKGEALVATSQKDAAIREYHALITRFPNSPEAEQAHAKLTSLSGVARR